MEITERMGDPEGYLGSNSDMFDEVKKVRIKGYVKQGREGY